jgi:alpha-1,3-glucan synthase
MPLQRALTGCYDDWNGMDHFDPTTDTRRMFAHFHYLRETYPALQDGFELVQYGNWTHYEQLPGSNETQTELGLWTVSRAAVPGHQQFTGANANTTVWMLYTNENRTVTYAFDCDKDGWISTPYVAGTVVKNLFDPFEEVTLAESQKAFTSDGSAGPPWQGCLPEVTMAPYAFKAFVPLANWVAVPPQIVKFRPGHDARIIIDDPSSPSSSSIPISLEFNVPMDCTSITQSTTFRVSDSGKGGSPQITNVQCGTVTSPELSVLPGGGTSVFYWNATVVGVPEGIVEVVVTRPETPGGVDTGVSVFFGFWFGYWDS